jgi:acetyl esterase/lipase
MQPAIRFLRLIFALGTVLVAGGCESVFFRAVNGGRLETPATFTYDRHAALQLDVYRPTANVSAAPVVLFFYGGSWRRGNRADYAFVGQALASRGIVTVIADYRKAPTSLFPVFEEDAAKAARWTFDNAASIGGDPHRVFVMGHSAGAHIAALLATDQRHLAAEGLRPRDFAGAIGVAGPYDFLPLTDPDLIQVFGPRSEWQQSQPINFVDGDEPPFLLLQGSADRIVDPRNANSLGDRLREHDIPVTQVFYPGVGHFRIVAALRFVSLAPTLEDVTRFVEAQASVASGDTP